MSQCKISYQIKSKDYNSQILVIFAFLIFSSLNDSEARINK